MKPIDISEIKVTMGKDVLLIEPKSMTWVIAGQSGSVPEKLAAKLFKSLASQVAPYFPLLKGSRSTDFNT